MKMILSLEKVLSKIVLFICGMAVIVGTLMVFTITVGRYAFGVSWEWAEEFSRYCVLFAALVGSGPMVFDGSHISMDLLIKKIKKRSLIFAQQIIYAGSTLFFSVLMLRWGLLLTSVTRMKSASLIFQMKMVYSMIPIAMAVMVLYSMLKIIVLTGKYIEDRRGENQ